MKTSTKKICKVLIFSDLLITIAEFSKTKNLLLTTIILLLMFTGIMTTAMAQEAKTAGNQATTADEAAIQANNPLASIKTFNLHNYYVPNLSGMPDATSNTFWFRYAQPIGRFLVRASLPLSTVPMSGETNKAGLGDLNAFATYLAIKNAKTTLGIGPLLAFPTASNAALGSGKWQAGLALIAFQVVSPQFQTGGLITWQMSYAGNADREQTNLMAVQIFGMWQLGGGTYLRSSGIMQFNLENGYYNVPFGLGLGKVLKTDKLIFNLFAEPQFTVLHYGDGQPQLQFFFGINTQF